MKSFVPPLSAKKAAFLQIYAETGNRSLAQRALEYNGFVELSPEQKRKTAAIQQQKLLQDGLPAAVKCLIDLVQNDKAPAGARVQAAKVIFDRTLGEQSTNDKNFNELTGAEIDSMVDLLRAEAARREKKAKDITPAKNDIFA